MLSLALFTGVAAGGWRADPGRARGGVRPSTGGGVSRPLLLTADETAELLRTTRKAVYAMVERGQLPGVTRIGRRLLVRRDALVDWLDQKRAPSLQETRR